MQGLKLGLLVPHNQDNHHNGDQAARRFHMFCSICDHRFATPRPGVHGGRGWADSVAHPWVPISSRLTHKYGLSLTVWELFSWLPKRFCPPARQPVPRVYDDKYRSRSCSFVEQQN